MKMMFGELLEKMEPLSEDKKVSLLNENKSPLMKDILKVFLIDGIPTEKLGDISKMVFKTARYEPDRMSHLYPEFVTFKRKFVLRQDITTENLQMSLKELLEHIDEYEARFIVEAILTKDSTIITKKVIEGVFPELLEVSNASV